mmetsp:Transcript_50748/g.95120  ORF Transcript_50748/g.95120 Transcript_50748/m.95120 type:complete len:966 (+) Transcript_50748:83-2980(+)
MLSRCAPAALPFPRGPATALYPGCTDEHVTGWLVPTSARSTKLWCAVRMDLPVQDPASATLQASSCQQGLQMAPLCQTFLRAQDDQIWAVVHVCGRGKLTVGDEFHSRPQDIQLCHENLMLVMRGSQSGLCRRVCQSQMVRFQCSHQSLNDRFYMLPARWHALQPEERFCMETVAQWLIQLHMCDCAENDRKPSLMVPSNVFKLQAVCGAFGAQFVSDLITSTLAFYADMLHGSAAGMKSDTSAMMQLQCSKHGFSPAHFGQTSKSKMGGALTCWNTGSLDRWGLKMFMLANARCHDTTMLKMQQQPAKLSKFEFSMGPGPQEGFAPLDFRQALSYLTGDTLSGWDLGLPDTCNFKTASLPSNPYHKLNLMKDISKPMKGDLPSCWSTGMSDLCNFKKFPINPYSNLNVLKVEPQPSSSLQFPHSLVPANYGDASNCLTGDMPSCFNAGLLHQCDLATPTNRYLWYNFNTLKVELQSQDFLPFDSSVRDRTLDQWSDILHAYTHQSQLAKSVKFDFPIGADPNEAGHVSAARPQMISLPPLPSACQPDFISLDELERALAQKKKTKMTLAQRALRVVWLHGGLGKRMSSRLLQVINPGKSVQHPDTMHLEVKSAKVLESAAGRPTTPSFGKEVAGPKCQTFKMDDGQDGCRPPTPMFGRSVAGAKCQTFKMDVDDAQDGCNEDVCRHRKGRESSLARSYDALSVEFAPRDSEQFSTAALDNDPPLPLFSMDDLDNMLADIDGKQAEINAAVKDVRKCSENLTSFKDKAKKASRFKPPKLPRSTGVEFYCLEKEQPRRERDSSLARSYDALGAPSFAPQPAPALLSAPAHLPPLKLASPRHGRLPSPRSSVRHRTVLAAASAMALDLGEEALGRSRSTSRVDAKNAGSRWQQQPPPRAGSPRSPAATHVNPFTAATAGAAPPGHVKISKLPPRLPSLTGQRMPSGTISWDAQLARPERWANSAAVF